MQAEYDFNGLIFDPCSEKFFSEFKVYGNADNIDSIIKQDMASINVESRHYEITDDPGYDAMRVLHVYDMVVTYQILKTLKSKYRPSTYRFLQQICHQFFMIKVSLVDTAYSS